MPLWHIFTSISFALIASLTIYHYCTMAIITVQLCCRWITYLSLCIYYVSIFMACFRSLYFLEWATIIPIGLYLISSWILQMPAWPSSLGSLIGRAEAKTVKSGYCWRQSPVSLSLVFFFFFLRERSATHFYFPLFIYSFGYQQNYYSF